MCYIDLDPCEVWVEQFYRAAKPHKCDTCGREIPKGRRYARIFMIFEGEPGTERACLPCFRAGGIFADAHDNMRPTPASLVEMLDQCIDENDEGVGQWKRMRARIRKRTPPAGATV